MPDGVEVDVMDGSVKILFVGDGFLFGIALEEAAIAVVLLVVSLGVAIQPIGDTATHEGAVLMRLLFLLRQTFEVSKTSKVWVGG